MVAVSANDKSMSPSPAPGHGTAAEHEIAKVYEEHFAFVWRSLRSLGVAPSSLDDAAQDVFVVVHRRFGEFEGRSSLRTWLFGIAYRVAASHRRVGQRLEHDELSSELVCHRPDPHQQAQCAQAARFVQAFLATLSDSNRAAFTACVLEQMSVAEAAEALEVNVNTMYTRVRAVRSQFANALAAAERAT